MLISFVYVWSDSFSSKGDESSHEQPSAAEGILWRVLGPDLQQEEQRSSHCEIQQLIIIFIHSPACFFEYLILFYF